MEITTRLSRREIKDAFKRLGSELKLGNQLSVSSFTKGFISHFTYELFSAISEAQQAKTRGLSDFQGMNWKALKKSTKKFRMLPSTRARFPNSGLLQPVNLSGKLLNSFRPGKVTGTGTYLPFNADQLVELSNGVLKLGTKVEYSTFQNKWRKLLPRNRTRLVELALERTIPAFIQWLSTQLR